MKRSRSASQDVEDSPPKQSRVVEEIVNVTETRPVLVRLPFLDYFRNAHLCERAASDPQQRDGPPEFAPDAVRFVPGTLETDEPKVLIRTGAHGALEFEGAWCEARGAGTAAPRSNRVVLELAERSGPGAGAGDAGGAEVASLLKHPAVGVTADEARGRERARSALWEYGRMDVPCATLVLRRTR